MADEDRTAGTAVAPALPAATKATSRSAASPAPPAAEDWGGLANALHAEPWKFDFFQAVRRIECLHPSLPRIGTSFRPADDPVRFAEDPSLSFAPSTVASYATKAEWKSPRLAVYFFGLLGPNGPLPSHLTEYAYERWHHDRDPTFARFLDIFHHRMLSFFYRAWARARPTVSYDRPDAGSDWFGQYLGSLFGLGMKTLRERDAMPDRAKLYYAGLLANQSKHPAGLRAILSDFFRIPVAIREFVPEWIRIPDAARARLGASPNTTTLGETLLLGLCVWSAQHRFRLVIGPLSFADFIRFLPGQPSLRRIVAFVCSYAGAQFGWDLNLVLNQREVPALRLDGTRGLGWTTWLPAERFDRDPDDLVLRLQPTGA